MKPLSYSVVLFLGVILMKTLSVVLPVYNEEDTLKTVLKQIKESECACRLL